MVASKKDIDITVENLLCLEDNNDVPEYQKKLNTDVVNFALELWGERHGQGSQTKMPEERTDGVPRCWIANTFMYSKLLASDG